MRFMKLAAATAVIAATGLLAACGSSSGSKAQVRLLNASAGYSSLDLTINSASIDTGVAFGTAGAYGSVDIDATSTQVIASGTTVVNTTPTLAGASTYSMIAYGWPGNMHTTLLQETQPAQVSGSAYLLALNLAPDAGSLDVYLVTPGNGCTAANLLNATPIAPSVIGGTGSGYETSTSGTYQVCITGAGNNADLRLSIPSITLASTSVNTLIITPTSGGVLVNAISLVQGGATQAYVGTNARVRLVGSLTNTAAPSTQPTIAGSVNGTNLLNSPSAIAPTIGSYVVIPAGSNQTVALNVNGVAVSGYTSGTFAAGGDYTLLVYGDASMPSVTPLTDDNRLPSAAGTSKVRLINGLASPNAVMTLSMDFTNIANNVAPGSASTFAIVQSDTTASSEITVQSPTVSGYVFDQTGLNIANLGVYNVYILANSSITTPVTTTNHTVAAGVQAQVVKER